jgi:hypothetical protein
MESNVEVRTQSREPGSTLKVFDVLMVAASLAAVAIVPYATILTGSPAPSMPLWQVLVLAALQNLVVVAPLAALGLWLGGGVGLGAPLLRDWIAGQPDAGRRIRAMVPLATGIGAVTGVVLIALGALFAPWLPAELARIAMPTWWQGLLAAFSAGINTDVVLHVLLPLAASPFSLGGDGRPPV